MTGDESRSERSSQPADDEGAVRHDWTRAEQPSMAVVEAVAAVTGRRLTELPPLQDTVDADALDALLAGASADVCVSFRYVGVEVTVEGGGRLVARPH